MKTKEQMDKPMEITDFESKDAADTLMKAEEIKANKKLMKHVKKHVGRKLKAITGLHDSVKSIKDIKELHNKKFGPKKDDMFEKHDDDMEDMD